MVLLALGLIGGIACTLAVFLVLRDRGKADEDELDAFDVELDEDDEIPPPFGLVVDAVDTPIPSSATSAATDDRVLDLERRFWELHGIVSRLLAQRDEWVKMWRQQAAEHLQGQALYERRIIHLRQSLQRTIATANHLGAELEKATGNEFKKIQRPADLDTLAEPVGQAERYFESMKKLLAAAPERLDPFTERDRITAEAKIPGSYRHRPLIVRAYPATVGKSVPTPHGVLAPGPDCWVVEHEGGVAVYDEQGFVAAFEPVKPARGIEAETEAVAVLDSA